MRATRSMACMVRSDAQSGITMPVLCCWPPRALAYTVQAPPASWCTLRREHVHQVSPWLQRGTCAHFAGCVQHEEPHLHPLPLVAQHKLGVATLTRHVHFAFAMRFASHCLADIAGAIPANELLKAAGPARRAEPRSERRTGPRPAARPVLAGLSRKCWGRRPLCAIHNSRVGHVHWVVPILCAAKWAFAMHVEVCVLRFMHSSPTLLATLLATARGHALGRTAPQRC